MLRLQPIQFLMVFTNLAKCHIVTPPLEGGVGGGNTERRGMKVKRGTRENWIMSLVCSFEGMDYTCGTVL